MECCTVGDVVAERDIAVAADEDVHEHLVARWLGLDEYHPEEARKLAEWFNQELLRLVYSRNGRSDTDARISSEYETLTGDDEVKKGEIIDDLRADGIDGDQVVADFVSRRTMRRHLTDCLESSKDVTHPPDTPRTWEREQIQRSEQHLKRKVRESVRSLATKGEVPGGTDADIDVSILLSCPECSTRVRLGTALERQFVCQNHQESSSVVTAEALNSAE